MTYGKSDAAAGRTARGLKAVGLGGPMIGLILLASAAHFGAGAQETAPQAAPEPTTETPTTETPAAETPADAPAAEPPAETAGDPQTSEPAATPPVPTPPAPKPPAPKPQSAEPKGPLVVVSWGGVYAKSQQEAVYYPFTRATGIEIDDKVYAGDLDQIRSQIAGGEAAWDVVDVDPADAEAGCNEGLFEKLGFVLPAAPDGTAADADFLPGTIHPCAIGSVAWSMVIARAGGEDAETADRRHPESLEDFFDLEAFPGGRGLRRTPMANLEWALLADGADPAEVYDLLGTEAGVARALAKLGTIKEAIVWWDDPDEPARLLTSGEVVMSSTYNAPILNDIAVREHPIELIWDRQLWDIDLWAVPNNAPHREAALEFVRFATGTEALARQTRWLPYGPVRRSALPLARDFVLADIDITPYLPTAPENMDSALRSDAVFWREEGPALVERFNVWLAR